MARFDSSKALSPEEVAIVQARVDAKVTNLSSRQKEERRKSASKAGRGALSSRGAKNKANAFIVARDNTAFQAEKKIFIAERTANTLADQKANPVIFKTPESRNNTPNPSKFITPGGGLTDNPNAPGAIPTGGKAGIDTIINDGINSDLSLLEQIQAKNTLEASKKKQRQRNAIRFKTTGEALGLTATAPTRRKSLLGV